MLRGKTWALPCIIGREGLVSAAHKKEGDWSTPKGCYPMRGLYYRSDRLGAQTFDGLKVLKPVCLAEHFGWCDDSTHPDYNQLVHLPHPGRHEKLWREDGLYDVIIPLGYNDDPVIAGKGSAIFIHCAEPDKPFTQGCIALKKEHLLTLINRLEEHPSIQI